MLNPLPSLMIAPNGVRRGKTDHPALPVTIAETVEAAQACAEAGANGIHLHVRDSQGAHTLDTGLYREALNEMKYTIPSLPVQMTTEALSIYTPEQQRAVVTTLLPDLVSVSLADEMV